VLGWVEKAVLGMVILRIISGTIEISAALIMLKLNDITKALMVNSMLAVIGPLILISTTTIGLLGISDRISFGKLSLIFLGVGCILIALRK
jgi:hypothetical protein